MWVAGLGCAFLSSAFTGRQKQTSELGCLGCLIPSTLHLQDRFKLTRCVEVHILVLRLADGVVGKSIILSAQAHHTLDGRTESYCDRSSTVLGRHCSIVRYFHCPPVHSCMRVPVSKLSVRYIRLARPQSQGIYGIPYIPCLVEDFMLWS